MGTSKRPTSTASVFLFILSLIVACDNGKGANDSKVETNDPAISGWKQEKIAPEALADWRLLGKGKVSLGLNEQVVVQEMDDSQGVMLVSPTFYEGDVVVRYQVLALTPATVFITMLAATDLAAGRLTIPDDYDGGMALWTGDAANYFFAFKNAPHGAVPFIAKNPDFAVTASAAGQDGMVAGVYYDVEIGKEGAKLWLSIDGRTVVEWEDEHPIGGGHVALRLRGTAGLAAVGAIKALTIYTR